MSANDRVNHDGIVLTSLVPLHLEEKEDEDDEDEDEDEDQGGMIRA